MAPPSLSSIAEQVIEDLHRFTPAEKKAAHHLLANYPMAGLETVAEFARLAEVSAPTVLRFTGKLGFSGYAEFQRILRNEVEARLQSPLMKTHADPPDRASLSDLVDGLTAAARDNVAETVHHLSRPEFEAIIDLLADDRGAIYLLGGRFTDPLAAYFHVHLRVLRPGVRRIEGQSGNWREHLLDLGRRDALIVFDIRRYQEDVVEFARAAQRRGAKIILFTDQWLSPIASTATHILAARIAVPSHWDSAVATVALIEALLAALTQRLWPGAKDRIEALEQLR